MSAANQVLLMAYTTSGRQSLLNSASASCIEALSTQIAPHDHRWTGCSRRASPVDPRRRLLNRKVLRQLLRGPAELSPHARRALLSDRSKGSGTTVLDRNLPNCDFVKRWLQRNFRRRPVADFSKVL
jgi:hypothetical protein